MSIVDQLATSLGRRDEVPNQELAQKIVEQHDSNAVQELIALLQGKNKDWQNDSIKVLYEVGHQQPDLIAPYLQVFVESLGHKNNRLQWGAMAALDSLALTCPQPLFERMPEVLKAADKGSVITKDGAVSVLIKLCSLPDFRTATYPLLLEQLLKAAPNQLPMYAERSLEAGLQNDAKAMISVLQLRLDDVEKESKKKRVLKVIKKLGG